MGAAAAVVAVTGDVPQIGNDTKETTECGFAATAALWITSKNGLPQPFPYHLFNTFIQNLFVLFCTCLSWFVLVCPI